MIEKIRSYLEKKRYNCISLNTNVRGSKIPTYIFSYNGTWILVIISNEGDDVYRCSDEHEVKNMLKKYQWQKTSVQNVNEEIDTGRFQKLKMNDVAREGHRKDF